MKKLRGAYTALVTPMKGNGDVDHGGWERLIRFQLDNGSAGVVPIGTTGENPTLRDDEEIDLIKEAVGLCRGKAAVIVGTGSNSTRDAVRYTERAAELGADAALVVTPYYNKPSDEGVFRHFEEVARVGLPVVVYNIAGRTGKNISTPLLQRIADLPGVVAVKEASGNLSQMMEVVAQVVPRHPGFAVLSGDDALTLPLMAVGGDGVISVVANAAPRSVADLVAACLRGDFGAARAIHYQMLPFMRDVFVETNPCPIKYALKRLGICENVFRLPLVPVTAASEKIIENSMRLAGVVP
jgi:4-hydroxy-tetrahydrodipicolinate synthase